MTKDQLKKYLDGVIDDIRTLYIKTQEKLREIQKKANDFSCISLIFFV